MATSGEPKPAKCEVRLDQAPGPEEAAAVELYARLQRLADADPTWEAGMRKRLLRKVDWRLLPMLVLMYMVNYLDRNNLSQARLGSLEGDLGMTGTNFNTATSILFVGYLLMQLPSNLLLTRVRPSLYLGAVMSVWGAVSAVQAGTHSYAGLVACRFCLGFAEAPFFPGAIFLMSSWYTRSEVTPRIAWFYAGSSLANAFGGLIGAGVLEGLNGARGISGWRWLFIIEGSFTVGLALTAMSILPDYPATTMWLTEDERAYAQWRLMEDISGEGDSASASSIRAGVMLALKDGRLYLFTLLLHASLLSLSFQYFFPTIVRSLGYDNVKTLLITAPVWIATFFGALAVTYSSARTGDRSLHIVAVMLVSLAGNVLVVSSTSLPVRFVAMFLMPMGALPANQIILAWVASTFPRPLVKRSACISFANMLGNCANIYGPYMYPATDGPRYLPGGCGEAAIAAAVAVLALVTRLVLQRDNRRLAAREGRDAEGNTVGVHGTEDERPAGFRYVV